MGIPIDGDAKEFRAKMIALGFSYDSNYDTPNSYHLSGVFYGEEADADVEYTYDAHTVYSVSVSMIKEATLECLSIQRDYLKAVEEKYKYEREVINPQLFQYDYYIYDGFHLVGLIQTFIVDSKTIPSSDVAMLSIRYTDVENYLSYENRKRRDI